MYVCDSSDTGCYQTAYNNNGYGGMAYYSSSTCGNGTYTGCTSNYAQSEVKYVVDAWKNAKAPAASEARLITYDELLNNLGFELDDEQTGYKASAENTPSWVYNSNYWYWTMSQYEDSASSVWDVYGDGSLRDYYVGSGNSVVRPVITISKSSI